jgi:hypothetical protein
MAKYRKGQTSTSTLYNSSPWWLCIGLNRPCNLTIWREKVVTHLHNIYKIDTVECLVVVGLDQWFELIQRRSRDNIRWKGISKHNCMREEAEFEVVNVCAKG